MADGPHSPTTLEVQRKICTKYGLPDTAPEEMVAVAMSTLGAMPIYGARIVLSEGRTIGWFFHCGTYSEANDFYQPVHTEHLNDILPLVIRYLRLPPDSKFIIDDQGYEDVWYEG